MKEKELLEQFVKVFKENNYSPISARILGIFYINNQKYFTFKELIQRSNASKSAMSKSLKFLINQGEVDFIFEKDNKRKRLFFMNQIGIVNNINKFINSRKLLNNLLKEIIASRNDENDDMNIFIKNLIHFNNEILVVLEKKLMASFDANAFIKK